MVKLTVVVITKNEKKNIADCLKTVSGWADEVIVVDDFSTDNTVEIAKRYATKVIQRKMEIEGRHRNIAYSLARNRWVFSLDADERVTVKLREEITKVISVDTKYAAFTIPRRNFLGNYWLRYGGLYPSPQLKLFKKDKFRWEEVEVHPRSFLDGPCGHLHSDLIHYTYRNFSDVINKLNNQTTREAIKWFKEKRKISLPKALRKTADRFLKAFIIKKGYKDGFRGFFLALVSGLYQIISFAKYWEMQKESK
jgi:glycosyltransferase involved in cell wall biosynthesis